MRSEHGHLTGKCPTAPHSTYLVTQPHNTTWGTNGDESTRNESFYASFLGGSGQVNLVLLLGGPDTTNNHINICQSFDEMFLCIFQVTSSNLKPLIFEARGRRFPNRGGADESDNLLNHRIVIPLVWAQSTISKLATYKVAIVQQPVGYGSPGFTCCSDQQNIGLRHLGNSYRSYSIEDVSCGRGM